MLKKAVKGHLIADYDFPKIAPVVRMFYPGIGVDDKHERRADQIDRRKRRGKVIPRKGEGKRAGNKKKR